MTTERQPANVVRSKFRDYLDAVLTGLQVIVLRHGKPVAVLISYDKWIEMGGQEIK